MTQDSATANGKVNQRPFIVRLLIALFRLVFWAALIGGVVAGGLYLQTQIETLRIQQDVQTGRVDLLRSDVDTYALSGVTSLESELSAISTTVSMATQDISQLETAAEEQSTSFTESMADLDARTAALEASSEEAQADLAAKTTAIETLQADLTALQALQDGTASDLSTLDTSLATVTDETSSLSDSVANLEAVTLEDTLANEAIFTTMRVWGLVTQARLSLATEDVPAAQVAIKSAQTAVSALLQAGSDTVSVPMAQVKENLDTAANDLGTDEASASDSLEAAWVILDTTLAEILGYAEIEADIIGQEETESEEAADDETTNEESAGEEETSNDESSDDESTDGEDDEGDEDGSDG